MNALDLVKAAKSATGDFGTFWTELYKIVTKLPRVFETFGDWGADSINHRIEKALDTPKEEQTGIIANTRNAFKK